MNLDLAIVNGIVVNHDGRKPAAVGVKDGRIVIIGTDAQVSHANEVVDADGLFVIPGAMDTHVHFGAYQPFEKDLADTAAAVVGGVTTIGNFLGTGLDLNPRSYRPMLEQYIDLWNALTWCDGFFHIMITDEVHLEEMGLYASEYGCTSFKFNSYRGEDAGKLGLKSITDGTFYEGFRRVAALGGTAVAMVHAENTEIIEVLRARLRQEGRSDLVAMREARPGWVEAIDVYKVAVMAEKTGAPLFIVHTSAAESVDVIQDARLRGINIMAETTPAYLTHTADDPIGAIGVEYPALKDEASKERLWQGIRSGIIEVIGTDYASIKKEEKQDIWTAKAGFGNLQVMLPALLSEGVGKGRISLEKAVEICCYKGALRFGLAGRKGKIDVGYDADIAVVDMDRTWTVTPEWLAYHYTDHTLYDGWDLTGWISKVYVRGKLVAQDGRTVGAPGWGKYLRREAD